MIIGDSVVGERTGEVAHALERSDYRRSGQCFCVGQHVGQFTLKVIHFGHTKQYVQDQSIQNIDYLDLKNKITGFGQCFCFQN